MNTEELWREYRREYKRGINQRDKALAHEKRMTAAAFARLNGMTPAALRRRMQRAGYERKGNRNLVPITDLEKFL